MGLWAGDLALDSSRTGANSNRNKKKKNPPWKLTDRKRRARLPAPPFADAELDLALVGLLEGVGRIAGGQTGKKKEKRFIGGAKTWGKKRNDCLTKQQRNEPRKWTLSAT